MVLGCYYLTRDAHGRSSAASASCWRPVAIRTPGSWDWARAPRPTSIMPDEQRGHPGLPDRQHRAPPARSRRQVMTRDEADRGHGRARRVRTTVGRVIFNQVLPERLRFVNQPHEPDRPARAGRRLLPPARPGRDGPPRRTASRPSASSYATRGGMTIAVGDIHSAARTSRPAGRGRRAGRRPSTAVPARPHHRGRALRAGRRGLEEDDAEISDAMVA